MCKTCAFATGGKDGGDMVDKPWNQLYHISWAKKGGVPSHFGLCTILYQSSNTFNLCTFFNHDFFWSSKKSSLYTNRGCFTVDSHSGTAMLPTATSANVNKAPGIRACDKEHLGQSWEDLTTIATWTCHTASHREGGSFLLGTSKAFEYVSILHSMESVTEFQPSIHSSLIRKLWNEVCWRHPSWDSSVQEAEQENV